MPDLFSRYPGGSTIDYRRSRGRLRALPLILLAGGLYLIVGCIPIPATGLYQPNGKRTPDAKIGTRPTDLVSIGRTRIEDALIVLQEQTRESSASASTNSSPALVSGLLLGWDISDDGHAFRIHYQVRTGTVVYPLCFMVDIQREYRTVQLQTDEAGVVTKAYVLSRQSARDPHFAGHTYSNFDLIDRTFAPEARRKLQEAGLLLSDQQRRELIRFQLQSAGMGWHRPATRPHVSTATQP